MKYLNCLVIGAAQSGKSSLVVRFADDIYDRDLIKTSRVDAKLRQMQFENKAVTLQIWDEKESELSWRCAHADAIVLTLDLSQSDQKLLVDLQNYSKLTQRHAARDTDFIIAGTKSDLVSEEQKSRLNNLIERSSIRKYLAVFAVSSKNNTNVYALFETLVKEKLKKDSSFKHKPHAIQPSSSAFFSQISNETASQTQNMSASEAELAVENEKNQSEESKRRCIIL